jgi:NAD(P)H dehydrogenase (quinone)
MITVTGASGQLGRLVAQALAERVSPTTVRLATRHPGKTADLAARGSTTVPADFDKPESLEAAFAGSGTVLIISGDAPNDVRIRQHMAAIDAAKRAGVGRVVYTSFVNPTPNSLFTFAAIHADSEAHIIASGIPFTILRSNQYAENLPVAVAKATGKLALPGAAGKVAHIARADVAAAIAGALTEQGHVGKIYDLTGPEALDLFEIAAILADSWGTPVTAVDLASTEFAKALAERGMPSFAVEAIVSLRQAVAAGEYAAVTDHASRLAGRPVQPLSSYLRRL